MEKANMKLYNAVREVPKEAKKPIAGGKLKGKTDINPMWRIKKLTEEFGPCGYGWYTEILEQRLEPLPDGRVAAFVNIHLFVMIDGKSSMPIPGTGGNMFVDDTRNGLQVNDDCFKMAYTDALSVACKALGFGADIYWDSDKTKYDVVDDKSGNDTNVPTKKESELSQDQITRLYTIATKKGFTEKQVKAVIKKDYKKNSTKDLTIKEYDELVKRLEAK